VGFHLQKLSAEAQLLATRTIETTITFRRPFALTSFDSQQPAGTYRLVIDEEEIVGLTCLAFQRVGTQLHTPALSAFGGPTQIFLVNAGELAAALRADGRDQSQLS
jgi:hypothetical protein